jgi:dihydroorotate dehydrogenase electron transfer subunit
MSCSGKNNEKSGIRHGTGTVESNIQVADAMYRLVMGADDELPAIRAGQFVMLRLPNRSDPLLGRPLAVYRSEPHQLEVIYLVVGKMTRRLAEVRPGDSLEFWTPLGNGFADSDADHTIMVAGGIGQTPFLKLSEHLMTRKTLLYGARNRCRMVSLDDFRRFDVNIHLATDDGSEGYHGLVTDLIGKVYQPGEKTRLLCCGPMKMLKSAFKTAQKLELPCEVSLETPMSCGLGICFGCVVLHKNDDGTVDYKRICHDGPVFDAYRLIWD